MERGLEQFVVLAVILLATLVDMVLRWLKRRARKEQPADVAGVEEEMVLVEEVEPGLFEPEPAEREVPPVTINHPRPLPRRSIPVIDSPPRPAPPPMLQEAARPDERPTTTPGRRRPSRARAWLKRPPDARRGIILMEVLGPCRGARQRE